MENRVRIAIQKSGRLSERSIEILADCSIDIKNGKTAALVASASNFPIDILFLRDDDIPAYVADGTVELGIVGENMIIESGADVNYIKKLGFGRCRICLAIPKGVDYTGIHFFEGKKIATSYPRILETYLTQHGVKAEVHFISGSVEIAPNIGLADAIFDIVSSGSTLLSNGLKEVETVMNSEAVLIAHKNLSPASQMLLDKIVFRLQSAMLAKKSKYIIMNVPNEAIEKVTAILPGMKSPTVVPLAIEGWSAMHTVLNEDKFWEVIADVKAAGAEGILVVPIEKLII